MSQRDRRRSGPTSKVASQCGTIRQKKHMIDGPLIFPHFLLGIKKETEPFCALNTSSDQISGE